MLYYICDFTSPAIRKCPYVPIVLYCFNYYMKKKIQTVIVNNSTKTSTKRTITCRVKSLSMKNITIYNVGNPKLGKGTQLCQYIISNAQPFCISFIQKFFSLSKRSSDISRFSTQALFTATKSLLKYNTRCTLRGGQNVQMYK